MNLKRTFFIFVFLATLIFSSCTGQKSEKNISNIQYLENYFTSNEISMPEGMLYAQNLSSYNDKIYLSGITSTNQPKRYVYSFDTTDKTFTEVNIDTLSDKYITAMYMNSEQIIIGSENGGVNINGKDVLELSAGKSARAFYETPDNELIVISSDAGNNFSANIYDNTTYELKDKLNFDEICNFEFGTNILNVHFKDGVFCVISEKYDDDKRVNDLYIISGKKTIESKHEDILPDTKGYYEKSYFNKRGNLCIIFRSLSDSSVLSIDELNISDGTRVNTYEETFNHITLLTFSYSPEKYDFLYWEDGKIYGYDADNVKKCEIVNKSDKNDFIDVCQCAAFYENRYIFYSIDMQSQDAPIMFTLDSDGKYEKKITSSDYMENGRAEDIILLSDGKMCVSEYFDEKYILRIVNENGDLLNSIFPCSETDEVITGIACTGKNGEIYFVQKTNSTGDKIIKISVFNEEGNIQREICITGDVVEDISIKGIFGFNDTDFLIYESESSEYITTFASMINYEDGALGERIMEGICGTCENSDGELYFYTSEGVYNYDIDTGNSDEVINWCESDIISQVYAAYFENKDRLICITNDRTGYHLLQLDRADKDFIEKLKTRKVIRLAGIDIQLGNISGEIEHFNNTNKDYRIQVTDYLKYSSQEDYDESIKKLNLDIVSGKVPDILIGTSDLDLKLYSSKNMFTDLNVYIEKDKTISRSDYLENILDCFTYDGKQVMFPLRFRIFSPVGKASVVGEKQGWTYDEFFKLAQTRQIFYSPTQEYLSEILIYSNITEFVDYSEKKCNFESGLFKQIIEYISENGVPYDENYISPSSSDDNEVFAAYCRRFEDDLCCAQNINTSSVKAVAGVQNGAMNGEKLAYKGVPTSKGNGVLAVPYPLIAITEQSENKDGAWEFVKQLISDRYQDESSTFPIKKSAFEKYINQSDQRTMFTERADRTMYKTDPLTDEDIEKFSQAVQNIDHIYTTDSTVNGIISEQLALYFHGEQSSSETASIIQSKVSRYLNEIK